MKKRKIFYSWQTVFAILTLCFFMFSFASCSKKIMFQKSEVVTAAKGKVKIKKDKNNNYAIEIDIKNLREPDRLDPPAKYYIVWIETSLNSVKNIGQIVTSNGALSNKMKASLTAISPVKPHRIFITTENDTYIRRPGDRIVLDTGNF